MSDNSRVIPPIPWLSRLRHPFVVISSAARNLVFREYRFFVYILVNRTRRVMYVGMTNDLMRRMDEHRGKVVPGFTAKYNVDRLVYFEETPDVFVALAREKQIKAWGRSKKDALVAAANPDWRDLLADFSLRSK